MNKNVVYLSNGKILVIDEHGNTIDVDSKKVNLNDLLLENELELMSTKYDRK